MSDYKSVIISAKSAKKIREGHLWVYSNEILHAMTPLSMFFSGEIVNIINEKQKSLGFGMINPQSLIAVRVLDNKKPLSKPC